MLLIKRWDDILLVFECLLRFPEGALPFAVQKEVLYVKHDQKQLQAQGLVSTLLSSMGVIRLKISTQTLLYFFFLSEMLIQQLFIPVAC